MKVLKVEPVLKKLENLEKAIIRLAEIVDSLVLRAVREEIKGCKTAS